MSTKNGLPYKNIAENLEAEATQALAVALDVITALQREHFLLGNRELAFKIGVASNAICGSFGDIKRATRMHAEQAAKGEIK